MHLRRDCQSIGSEKAEAEGVVGRLIMMLLIEKAACSRQ
jgi:hypothetical protein